MKPLCIHILVLLRRSWGSSPALPMECDQGGGKEAVIEDTESMTTLSGSSGGGWQLEPRKEFSFRLVRWSNLETLVLFIIHNY